MSAEGAVRGSPAPCSSSSHASSCSSRSPTSSAPAAARAPASCAGRSAGGQGTLPLALFADELGPRSAQGRLMATQKDTVRALLDRHGRTFADELGIDVAKNTPAALFRLLCAATLMSARISS